MMDVEISANSTSFKENFEDQLQRQSSDKINEEKLKSQSRLQKHTFASSRAVWKGDEAELSQNERTASLRRKSPVKLSEHLLEPTAANIHSQLKLKEAKDKTFDDDIWSSHSPKFEVLSKVKTNFDNVKSKLLKPTSSMLSSSQLIKEKEKERDTVSETIRTVKPISPSSHVLSLTTSLVNGAWKKDYDAMSETPSTKSEMNEPRFLSRKTGPLVESRLFEATSSYKAATWKSKEYLQAEEELKLEEEKAAKASLRKVSKPSEHLLTPTAALENGKYKYPDTTNDQSSSTSPGKKVRSTSLRLLEYTAAVENGKYKPPEEQNWQLNEKSLTAAVPQRLLTPTASFEKAKYRKPDNDVDPRELGWKMPDPKPPKLIKVEPESSSDIIPSKSTIKVKETSERVLMLTVAHQRHRQSASPENYSVVSRSYSASAARSGSRASSATRAVSCTESFLRPTSSSSARAKLKGSFLLSSSSQKLLENGDVPELLSLAKVYRPEKVYEVPASLLKPTAAMRYRGFPDNLSDLSEGSFEDEPKMPVDKIRPVTNTEKFLAPTLSSTLHFAPELQKPKLEVKPVKSTERFLAPTKSFENRLSEPKPQKTVVFGHVIENDGFGFTKHLSESKVNRNKSPGRMLKRSNSLGDVKSDKSLRDDSVGRIKKYVSVKKLIKVFSTPSQDNNDEDVC